LKDKTLKILNLIAKYIAKAENKEIYEEDIINELLDMDFDINDIDVALFWLESMGLNINQLQVEDHNLTEFKSIRLITNEEKNFLTNDAIEYLYLLKDKGLIDGDMFEDILEKVVVSNINRKLGIDEIKLLTALTAFGNNKNLFNYIMGNNGDVLYN
jgi:uncharacterized protein Smg (DUF494 family)